jgi:phosphoribosylanthranilate isomerase
LVLGYFYEKKEFMLSKKVLVKSITNLSEARYCAGMMVDFISFDFNPDSKAFVKKEHFEEIRNWLSGVKILGLFDSLDATEVQSLIKEKSLDGFIFQDFQEGLISQVEADIKMFETKLSEIADKSVSGVDNIIVYADQKIEKLPEFHPNILVGYDFDNLDAFINSEIGFAFYGSKELRPGFSTYDELMDCLEKLDD